MGEILLWDAVAKSKNTSAVWLMNELGVNAAVSKLDDFGIPYTDADKNLSLALGSFRDGGVSPLQMASAYSAFANGGVRSEGQYITGEDQQGNIVVEEQEPVQNQAVFRRSSRRMTAILMSVYDEGGTGSTMEPEG